jgi:hypothetical protein
MRWSAYVVGAGGIEPPSSSVSDPPRISPLEFETVRHSEEPCRNRRSTALSARRLAHDSPWFRLRPYRSLRTAFAARLLPLVDP